MPQENSRIKKELKIESIVVHTYEGIEISYKGTGGPTCLTSQVKRSKAYFKGWDLMFKQIIVKKPGKSYKEGLTTSDFGEPDYNLVLEQHEEYIEALKKCDVKLTYYQ